MARYDPHHPQQHLTQHMTLLGLMHVFENFNVRLPALSLPCTGVCTGHRRLYEGIHNALPEEGRPAGQGESSSLVFLMAKTATVEHQLHLLRCLSRQQASVTRVLLNILFWQLCRSG